MIWLKARKVEIDVSPKKTIASVGKKRMSSLKLRDSSIAGAFARAHRIHSGKAIGKLEIAYPEKHIGVNAIVKLGTCTFKFTKHLIRIYSLDKQLAVTCFCCGANEEEDIWHLLARCQDVMNERKRLPLLDRLITRTLDAEKRVTISIPHGRELSAVN